MNATLPPPPGHVVDLLRLLQAMRVDLSCEKRMQEDIATALSAAGVTYQREKHLSRKDIPDFIVAGGILIECKVRNKSSKMAVYRQLVRYAAYPEVQTIILASNMSMGLPQTIEGKPLFAASLSLGWI